MGLTLLKVCLALALVLAMAVAAHSENHGGLRERGREARQGPGRDHVREASPRDGPRIRREPPQRHHYGPGPPGPPSSGPRPSKSSAYGPPHGHGHAAHHGHSSKPRYGPPPQSAPPKHRAKPVYGPKGKGKGHSHGPSHIPSHGLDSFEATSTYDRPTRQSYGPSKSGYGHPSRGAKPHRPKTTYSLGSSGGFGGPSKPSYGPPSKPSKPHSGNKYRKNKYRGQKPVYGPSKPFKPSSAFSSPPSSTYSGPPSSTYSSPSSSSAEYSPSEPSTPSHLVNSYGEPAQHGASANYAPAKVSPSSSASLAHSAESGSGSVGSYEDTSSYDASYSSYSKPQQHGDGNTEIQPSISYTLLPTYGGGSTLSPDHKPSSSGGSFQESYKQKTPYSYRAPYDAGTSFKNPVSHGGAATSYISVNHPGATAQPPASEEAFGYGSASSPASASVSPGASHGQAVLTTGYRAPDSTYEGSANYASSKPAAATYYSSIPAYGRQQGQAASQGYRQHQQHQQHQQQQQYGDIQTAGSSVHPQQVQPGASENFQAPAEVFGFVPYKSVAVSASVNTQGASASIPIHVPSHVPSHSHAANEVQAAAPTQSTTPNLAGGLSPQDWDAYYGDSSKQAKPQQQPPQQQQSDVLSPNYYDPLPQQDEEEQHHQQQQQQHQDPYGSKVGKHRHHSSNSRKKDTTQAHLKMLLQQRAQQQQQANKRYSQQAQVLAQQQQQQQHANARDSYATEENAEEVEDGDVDVEDSKRR